ncbi:MAG: PEGA domain-containing protein [Trueperaceae bacterium]
MFAFRFRSIVLLFVVVTCAAATAQVTVPTLGTRGSVPEALVRTVTDGIRDGLRAAGLDVRPGDLVTAGIAGSLDPEFTRLIGDLDGSAYALSGEVAVAGPEADRPYLLNLVVVEVATERSSDLISRPLGEDDAGAVAAAAAREVASFARTATRLPEGDAGLFVTSEPRGAHIAVDGVPIGATGAAGPIQLAPGRYRVELRTEGFLPETRSVEVRSGQTRFVHVVLTAISGGSVRVQSVPDARVTLDGEAVGRTPLTVPASAGRHVVTLERDGFAPERIEVPIRTYRVTRVDARLTPQVDPLLFWAEERGTLVRIDGRLQPGGYAADLRPGLRRIELLRPNGRIEVLRVVPDRGAFELDLTDGRLHPLQVPNPGP